MSGSRLEESRKMLVDGVVDALDSIAKAKEARDRLLPRSKPRQNADEINQGGDLLYDLLNLQFDYFKELRSLARVSADYRQQAGDVLLRGLGVRAAPSAPDVLTFRPALQTHRLPIENSRSADARVATVSCSDLQAAGLVPVSAERIRFYVDGAEVQSDAPFAAPYRRPRVLVVHVPIGAFAQNSLYTGELAITVEREHPQKIAIRVDTWRGA